MPRKKVKHVEALDSWIKLMRLLPTMSNENEVRDLMEHELGTRKRLSFVRRLHTRFCRLRQVREQREHEGVCGNGQED